VGRCPVAFCADSQPSIRTPESYDGLDCGRGKISRVDESAVMGPSAHISQIHTHDLRRSRSAQAWRVLAVQTVNGMILGGWRGTRVSRSGSSEAWPVSGFFWCAICFAEHIRTARYARGQHLPVVPSVCLSVFFSVVVAPGSFGARALWMRCADDPTPRCI